MNKEITIHGMTCQNCVKKVTQALELKPEIDHAKIQLAPVHSNLVLNTKISDERLNDWLNEIGGYHFTTSQSPKSNRIQSSLKTYYPLILSFAFISIISSTVTLANNQGLGFAMHIFMGSFFVLFSYLKFLDLRGFASSFAQYDIIGKNISWYNYLYPFIELGLGLAFLSFAFTKALYLTTMIIMFVATIGVINAVNKKQKIQCACMGNLFDLPMSTITIFENGLMIIMALIMYFNS